MLGRRKAATKIPEKSKSGFVSRAGPNLIVPTVLVLLNKLSTNHVNMQLHRK